MHGPDTLAPVQVGVYVGCCGSELHAQWLSDIQGITGYEQTGCTLSMFANRLSFTFDFRGPSKAVDTGAQHIGMRAAGSPASPHTYQRLDQLCASCWC